MSLRYRGLGGLILVDSSDTTPDFLSPKLAAGPGVSLLVQNPGGDENILVSTDGKLLVDATDSTRGFLTSKLVTDATITETVLNPGANEQLKLVVNTGNLDTRYIKRSPSGEDQVILPLTDNVPLTIQARAGAVSHTLDVFGSGGLLSFSLDNTGIATFLHAVKITPVNEILLTLTASSVQTLDMVDIRTNTGVLAFEMLPSGAVAMQANTGQVPLTLTGTSADILDLLSSTGALVFKAGPTGALTVAPSSNLVPLTLQAVSGGTVDILDLKSPTAALVFNVGATGATSILPSSDVITMVLKSGGGVSDILEIKDNVGVVQAKFSNTGTATLNQELTVNQANSVGVSIHAAGSFDTLDIINTASVIAVIVSPQGLITLSPGLNATPLTINGLSGGQSIDLFDIQNGGVTAFKVGGSGQLTILPNSNVVPLTLQEPSGGTSDILDLKDSSATIGWQFLSDVTLRSNAKELVFASASGAASDVELGRTAVGVVRVDIPAGGPAGTLAQLALLGNEGSAAERRIRENAGAMEITDTTPTVLRSIITRSAPNVAVAHNATSVAVAFATSEPDTSYEISVVPGYNTTVWYTLKSTVGFTANFGTAGPVGGSTFDWHIERIPRT